MVAGATLEVIAEPSRRRILDELLLGEQSVSSLVERLSMAQPVISKNLRILREAGLVQVRPEGQRRYYSLQLEPFLELDEWLEPYRRMWQTSLVKLERHLTSSKKHVRRRGP
jgi:DNA-binding transcriptional ArsR family regulator